MIIDGCLRCIYTHVTFSLFYFQVDDLNHRIEKAKNKNSNIYDATMKSGAHSMGLTLNRASTTFLSYFEIQTCGNMFPIEAPAYICSTEKYFFLDTEFFMVKPENIYIVSQCTHENFRDLTKRIIFGGE